MIDYNIAISEAALLLQDGSHSEYERGICELIARMYELCECDTDAGSSQAYFDIQSKNGEYNE